MVPRTGIGLRRRERVLASTGSDFVGDVMR